LDPFATLEPTFALARDLGFLGPGPVEPNIEHALGFVEVIEAEAGAPRTVVDLGTGGGVPGLVLAACWLDAQVTLVESMSRRAAFLREAASACGWGSRVAVVQQRAEEAARNPEFRESADVATARSFAEPAVTAEIGAAFVRVGGILVVSEPPEPDATRWPEEPLRALSLGPARLVAAKAAHFSVFSKLAPAPTNVPRPTGRPTKRPLW
jgi:16S rRNA (guanine527-N7)-methyltransferase